MVITINIKDWQVPHIQRSAKAKEAWDSLREVHQGMGTNGRMILTQHQWRYGARPLTEDPPEVVVMAVVALSTATAAFA